MSAYIVASAVKSETLIRDLLDYKTSKVWVTNGLSTSQHHHSKAHQTDISFLIHIILHILLYIRSSVSWPLQIATAVQNAANNTQLCQSSWADKLVDMKGVWTPLCSYSWS